MICIKTKYISKEFADSEVKRLKKISTRDVIPIRSYLCEKCGCWHLTSREDKHTILILELQERVRNQKAKINELNKKLHLSNETIKELKYKLNFRGGVPDKK